MLPRPPLCDRYINKPFKHEFGGECVLGLVQKQVKWVVEELGASFEYLGLCLLLEDTL